MTGNRPAVRPARPFFSSGPCAKRPGWTPDNLHAALLGRSHRSKPGKAKLKDAIDRTRALLGIPADYRIGIVPASDTGAVEMAMWSLLGPLPVDLFAWESFGEDWVTDAVKQLKLKDARIFKADYGELPDLSQADPKHDLVFLWNGTTSGVRVPDGDWIASERDGHHDLRRDECRLRDGSAVGQARCRRPSPGRRCWAAKRHMACWCCRPARWRGSNPTRRPGRCRKSSA